MTIVVWGGRVGFSWQAKQPCATKAGPPLLGWPLAPCSRGVPATHPFYILVVDIVFCTAINWFFLYSERWQKNDEH